MISSARWRTSSICVLVLAERQVPGLVQAEPDEVALAEEPAPVQALGQVERAGTADDRVVDVEEGAGAGAVRAGPGLPGHRAGTTGLSGAGRTRPL